MLDKLFSIPTSTSSPVGQDWGEGKTTAPISDDLEDEIHFVWDGSHLLQEVYLDGRYTYIYTNPDSYEFLAQVHNWTNEEGESHQQTHYFHCDQIGILREITDIHGNLVWLELHFDPDLLNRITRVMGAMSEGVRKELERWEFCVE